LDIFNHAFSNQMIGRNTSYYNGMTKQTIIDAVSFLTERGLKIPRPETLIRLIDDTKPEIAEIILSILLNEAPEKLPQHEYISLSKRQASMKDRLLKLSEHYAEQITSLWANEYSKVEIANTNSLHGIDKEIDRVQLELKNLRKNKDAMHVNIGGTHFVIHKDTCAKLGLYGTSGSTFIDRDPTHYKTIFAFLQEKLVNLPINKSALLEILSEAKYFHLKDLENLVHSELKLILT